MVATPSMARPTTAGDVAALLASEQARSLSDEDLIALALFLKPDARFDGRVLATTLVRYGFGASDQAELAFRLHAAARGNRAVSERGGGFDLIEPASIWQKARSIVARVRSASVAPAAPDAKQSDPERGPDGRRRRVRGTRVETHSVRQSRSIPKDVIQTIERMVADEISREEEISASDDFYYYGPTFTQELMSRPHRAAERQVHERSARGRKQKALKQQRTEPARPQRHIEVPRLSVPRQCAAAMARIEPASTFATAGLYQQSGSLEELTLVLQAHAIAAAGQFQELMSLSALVGVESHQYQIETVRRVLRVFRGRALLADEVGLGKTIEALMILREYQLRGLVRRALVLTPPALVHHWAGELAEKGNIAARTTSEPSFRRDPEEFWSGEGVVVASLATARAERHLGPVTARQWDLVIVDEAHHAKNRRSSSFKLVYEIKSRFLLLLTATPIETDIEELYNLVTLLKPGQFATPADFRRQYVDPKDPTAPRNSERLRALLAEVMVRNTRAQSGLMLPPRLVTTLVVDPSPAETALYSGIVDLARRFRSDSSAQRACATLLSEAGSAPAAVRGTLQRLSIRERHSVEFRSALHPLRELEQRVSTPRKDAAILELIAGSSDQVLIFTRYRDSAEHLVQTLKHARIDVEWFHGGLSSIEKRDALERFRAGTRCLVATEVGGEGQNLQFCHLLINYDLPWNPMVIEQRIGRLHRMGQTHAVRVFNLCARGTVEERLLEVLDKRLHLFELVVGEMDMVLGNLADERDLEERIFELYSTSRDDTEIERGFETLAQELLAARGRYEKVRALDEALFKTDFEA
jgi:superfamily II DNA or RNA helicase